MMHVFGGKSMVREVHRHREDFIIPIRLSTNRPSMDRWHHSHLRIHYHQVHIVYVALYHAIDRSNRITIVNIGAHIAPLRSHMQTLNNFNQA
jgi:hypothetical protein